MLPPNSYLYAINPFHPLYQLNLVYVDCQPKLSKQPQVQAPDRSTGAVSTLDGAEMPTHGKSCLINLRGNNCQVYFMYSALFLCPPLIHLHGVDN